MSVDLDIRRLSAQDADALIALRREALQAEPLAFAASLEDDFALLRESVLTFLGDSENQAVFGQFDAAQLIGMIGLFRGAKVKQRHKGMMWGMNGTPRGRHQRIGRALHDNAMEHARG